MRFLRATSLTLSGRSVQLTEGDRDEGAGVVFVKARVDGWQAGLLRLPIELWTDLQALQRLDAFPSGILRVSTADPKAGPAQP